MTRSLNFLEELNVNDDIKIKALGKMFQDDSRLAQHRIISLVLFRRDVAFRYISEAFFVNTVRTCFSVGLVRKARSEKSRVFSISLDENELVIFFDQIKSCLIKFSRK